MTLFASSAPGFVAHLDVTMMTGFPVDERADRVELAAIDVRAAAHDAEHLRNARRRHVAALGFRDAWASASTDSTGP